MSRQVLLVDDEAAFVDALALRLEARGIEVDTAYDGETALARLSDDVRVVVLDVNLPGQSGLDVLDAIKERSSLAEVLMLTGQADVRTAVEGMKRGAADYLLKPVDIETLAEAIRLADRRREQSIESRRLRETARLATLGGLARGVAHELNNPVNVMVTSAGWMLDLLGEVSGTCPEYGELKDSAERIIVHGRRCKELTLKLLKYCGQRDARIRENDLAATLGKILEVFAERIGAMGVRTAVTLPTGLPPLLWPPADLEDVLRVLVENALDAMNAAPPGQGRLNVSARVLDNRLEIAVADTGHGIPADILPRIFDPFFSTKAPGEGMGLGLAICHTIVTGHGGRVEVESEAGKGTVFHVRIPFRSPPP